MCEHCALHATLDLLPVGVLGNHEQDDDVGPFQLVAGPSRLR